MENKWSLLIAALAGTFMGPIVAGFFYDLTKGYTIAFGLFAVVSLVEPIFMFLAKPPKS